MAEIISFPVTRQTTFVRETARILFRKQGAAADRFWQITRRRLQARLQVQGLPAHTILEEVRAFSAAVYGEVHRLGAADLETDNPRGAA